MSELKREIDLKRYEGHTPGPWVVDIRSGCCAIYQWEREKDTNGLHDDDSRNLFYSSKGARFNGDHWEMDEETRANYRLIADAPMFLDTYKEYTALIASLRLQLAQARDTWPCEKCGNAMRPALAYHHGHFNQSEEPDFLDMTCKTCGHIQTITRKAWLGYGRGAAPDALMREVRETLADLVGWAHDAYEWITSGCPAPITMGEPICKGLHDSMDNGKKALAALGGKE